MYTLNKELKTEPLRKQSRWYDLEVGSDAKCERKYDVSLSTCQDCLSHMAMLEFTHVEYESQP